ncbi:hypothetical protein BKD02_05470 [Brucella sp. 09RB8910]|nr:hypothetical protein BKD02_05470 [Brucella sp. 09RB8910]
MIQPGKSEIAPRQAGTWSNSALAAILAFTAEPKAAHSVTLAGCGKFFLLSLWRSAPCQYGPEMIRPVQLCSKKLTLVERCAIAICRIMQTKRG